MDKNDSKPANVDPQLEGSLTRTILSLALPALGTLVAEPLLTAADSAMVGHLGTSQLAGLSTGSTVLVFVVGVCIFLAYTTTAIVGRLMGQRDRAGALRHGIQCLWLSATLGLVLALFLFGVAGWASAITGTSGAALTHATTYVRASAFGLVGMLVSLAGNGVLRGLLDTRTPLVISTVGAAVNVPVSFLLIYPAGLGVAGAALGTMIAQTGMGLAFIVRIVRLCVREDVSIAPSLHMILTSGVTGFPLVVRSLALNLAGVFTLSAAARFGEVTLASHQILATLWSVCALSLDALAIAGQAIVARRLGEGGAELRDLIRALTRWGVGLGLILAAAIAVCAPVLPYLFSPSPEVVSVSRAGLIVVALCQVLAGVVYMYDGILIGANDAKYLAIAQVVTVGIYTPAVCATNLLDLSNTGGLVAVWACYGTVLFGMRWLTLYLRIRTDAWIR